MLCRAVLAALVSVDLPVKTAEPIVKQALRACRKLPVDERVVYSDIILGALGPALKEALMPSIEGYKFRSEFALKHQAIGRADGAAAGIRESILGAFETREMRVNAIAKRRIMRESDLERLRRWHKRAVTVDKASEMFDE